MNLQILHQETEYSWAAGLFEGEGSITIDHRAKGRYEGKPGGSVRLCVCQAHDPSDRAYQSPRAGLRRGGERTL